MYSSCITMPEDFYKFLLAIPVVQDYQLQVGVGAEKQLRDPKYQITFRMNEKFKFFEPVLRVLHNNVPIFDYSGWNEKARREFDCFVDLDFERAEHIAKRVNFHITMGLNVLVGSGCGSTPVLKALQLTTDIESNVLLIPWDDGTETGKFYEYLILNHPELDVVMDPRPIDDFDVESVVRYANAFHCIIGPFGPLTYLATALKRVVIEIFPSQEEGVLYGCEGNPRYQGVTTNGGSLPAGWLWTVWRNLWPKLNDLISSTKSPDAQTPKVGEASTADNVDVK